MPHVKQTIRQLGQEFGDVERQAQDLTKAVDLAVLVSDNSSRKENGEVSISKEVWDQVVSASERLREML